MSHAVENSRAPGAEDVVKSNEPGISEALEVIKRAAAGDFEARLTGITATGELGELLYTVNDLIDRCDAYVRESAACMEHVQDKKFFRKIIETSMQGAFLNASKTVNGALATMQKQVEDFTSITQKFEDTVGSVVKAVASNSNDLSNSSQAMQSIAKDTSERANSVAAAAHQTSTNVETVAAASEELSASISEIAQQVGSASNITGEAADLSENMSAEVGKLEGAAQQIQGVVELINTIARQTNLLALNATIEAARAGEAGRGFAVVANEVKSLAKETAEATDQIGDYVTNIQAATKNTVGCIGGLSEKITEISSANNSVSAAVEEQSAATNEIARNIQEASAGTSEVTQHIGSVTDASEKTGNAASEVNQAAQELSAESETLRKVTDEFLVAVRRVI